MLLFGLLFLLLGAAIAAAEAPVGAAFAVPVVPNSNFQPNPLADLRRAHARYGGRVIDKGPDDDLGRLDGTGSVAAVNQPFDREYLSPILVGSPGQQIWMDFDTGSADTWTYTTETPSAYLGEQSIYRPEKSTSAAEVANTTCMPSSLAHLLRGTLLTVRLVGYITYGDGTYAAGSVYRDSLEIGGLKIHNGTVQSASHVSADMISDPVMSGILGLCRNHSSTTHPSQPTVFEALAGQLDRKLFGVDLRYRAAGSYDFGFVNASAYGGAEADLEWRPLLPNDDFWTIHVEKIHVGGTNKWYKHAWPMVVDTGTTLLMLPRSLTKMYYDQVPSAAFDGYWGAWLYDCNATLPDWHFGFTKGWSHVVPGRLLEFQNVTATRCFGGIQNGLWGTDFGILGDVWFKNMYVVFDIEGERVGLAKKALQGGSVA